MIVKVSGRVKEWWMVCVSVWGLYSISCPESGLVERISSSASVILHFHHRGAGAHASTGAGSNELVTFSPCIVNWSFTYSVGRFSFGHESQRPQMWQNPHLCYKHVLWYKPNYGSICVLHKVNTDSDCEQDTLCLFICNMNWCRAASLVLGPNLSHSSENCITFFM